MIDILRKFVNSIIELFINIFSVETDIVLGSFLASFLSGVLIAYLTSKIAKKYFKMIKFAKDLSKVGLTSANLKNLDCWEKRDIHKTSKVIRIINVVGRNTMNELHEYLIKAANNGAVIQFLMCDPHSKFIEDIENLERKKKIRKDNENIEDETIDFIRKYTDVKMEIRFYSSQYRLPYVLSYNYDCIDGKIEKKNVLKRVLNAIWKTSDERCIKAWMTMSLPPYKTTKKFILRGEYKFDQPKEEDVNMVEMMHENFESIWENGSMKYEEWREKNKKWLIDNKAYDITYGKQK